MTQSPSLKEPVGAKKTSAGHLRGAQAYLLFRPNPSCETLAHFPASGGTGFVRSAASRGDMGGGLPRRRKEPSDFRRRPKSAPHVGVEPRRISDII